MITRFKIFENLNFLPKKGDYIKYIDERFKYKTVYNFFKDNIGQIIKIGTVHGSSQIEYCVKFENIPDELKSYFTSNGEDFVTIDYIECWSENKDDLETYINTKKYNV